MVNLSLDSVSLFACDIFILNSVFVLTIFVTTFLVVFSCLSVERRNLRPLLSILKVNNLKIHIFELRKRE